MLHQFVESGGLFRDSIRLARVNSELLSPGATALAAANVSNRSLRRFGQRRFEYHGYYGYGKRSVDGYGDKEELEAIQEKVAEMFHRASQMDGEQCVRRLICEVNAEHGSSESSLEISVMDKCPMEKLRKSNVFSPSLNLIITILRQWTE